MSGAQAGFKTRDLIIEVAGKDVSNDAAEFGKALKAVSKGARVNAVVLRTGRMQTVGPIVFND
jgi:S1-C subfamily serine protease